MKSQKPRRANTSTVSESQAYAQLCKQLGAGATKILDGLLTSTEKHNIVQRWRISQMLADGMAQRTIAATLGVSLCKIFAVVQMHKPAKRQAKPARKAVPRKTTKRAK